MKTILAILAVLLTVMLFATLLAGQAAPSYKQTLSWMHNTSNYGCAYSGEKDNTLSCTEVPLENTCHKFVIVQTITGKHRMINTTVLDLATLEAKRVYGSPTKGKPWGYVDVNTTNDEETIHVTWVVDGKETNNSYTAGLSLEFDDGDFAPRFGKALRHAVELCGGKSSTF